MGLLASGPARADLTFYGDRSSYEAATTGNTVIDFEGIAADNDFTPVPLPVGLTVSGVNFTIDQATSDGFLFVVGKGYYYAGNSVLTSQQSTLDTNNLVITLPGGFTAIAMDLGSFIGQTFTFTLSTGDTFTEPAPALPDLGFAGFTSTVPIVSLRIDSPKADVMNLDNFTFGTATVPEPGALALLGAGALGLAGWSRRRGRRARTA
jgi:hypothetical protein